VTSVFDPSLLPEGCGACQQRVVKVAGRCPVCAAREEQARASTRPVVAPGPWPRVRVAGAPARDVRVATVVEFGRPPAVRVEPDLAAPGAVVLTALVEGVSAAGLGLTPGRRTPAPGGVLLELPEPSEEAP
jgi:hypothetical protein